MKVLAIDTTAKIGTVALVSDSEIISEYSLGTNSHSTTLLPMINNMLTLSGLVVSQIEMFAVAVGPGSFTGVRIGVATIKGLAFSDNIPCVGVSSIEAMAMNFTGINGIIVPVINARNHMVYSAVFSSNGREKPYRLSPDEQIDIEKLIEKLSQYDSCIYFTGDAYDILINESVGKLNNVGQTPIKLRSQSGYGVAVAAESIWCKTEDKSIFTEAKLAPVYLRKSQAEREREEKLKI